MSTKFLPQITVPFPKMTLFGNIFWDNFQPSLDQEFSPHHAVCLWLRDCANKLLRIHLCGRPWRKDCFHMKKTKKVGHNFQTHGTIQFEGSGCFPSFEKVGKVLNVCYPAISMHFWRSSISYTSAIHSVGKSRTFPTSLEGC